MGYLDTFGDFDNTTFAGDEYSDFAARIKALGGYATNWPFSSGIYGKYYGLTAAAFPAAAYAVAANARQIDGSAPTQASANNQTIYVLAPANVQNASPKTASLWSRLQNFVFTKADQTADAVGLPSLASIEQKLTGALKGGAVLAVLGIGGYLFLTRRRK